MFGRVNVSLYMLRSFDKGQAIVSARNWWRHFFIQESPHSKKERVQAFGATICGIVWVDKRNFWLVNGCLGYHRPITEQMLDHPNVVGNHGRFPFNKNCCLKFRQFHVPSGTSHSGCTDPTQAAARLVIVLVSRIQKSGTRNNNFVKWKDTFRSDRPKLPDRSCYTASLYLDWSYNPKGNIALVGRTQSLVFNMVFSGWRVRLWLFRDKLLQKEKNVRLANSFLGTRDNTDPLLVIAPRHHEPTLWGRGFLQRSDSQMINIRRKSSLHQNKGQRINDHAASRFAASRPSSEA